MINYCQQIAQKNLEKLLQIDKPREFSSPFVQRHLFLGYNQAMYALEYGVEVGALDRVPNSHRFKVREDTPDCRSNKEFNGDLDC